MVYEVSTERARVDVDTVVAFLGRAYWSKTRTRQQILTSLDHSLNFGAYHAATGRMVGFARVVTDYATFAWLCDVFVDEAHRGHGIGKMLMVHVLSHPRLQGLRRYLLATADAHELYRRFGFTELNAPARWMEIDTTVRPMPPLPSKL